MTGLVKSASSAQLKPSPVPTSDPLTGGSRRYVRSSQLFRNVAGAGASSGSSVHFRAQHPSVRLHGALTIGFRGDNGEDPTIPGAAQFSVTLDAWAKTDRESGGFPLRGNQIIPGPFSLANNLPFTYEAVTGVDEWRGLITVANPSATTLETSGWFWLNMMWEVVAGATPISDDELGRIFQSCRIQVDGGITVFGG